MGWQERLRELVERLTRGEITTGDYRRLSEGILAEADAELGAGKVRIPRSAAWEAPSGEMTQIVGERTVVVDGVVAGEPGESAGPGS